MAHTKRLTKSQVASALCADNYPAAKKLGAAAIPHLQSIVEEDDHLMAAKAAYLAGMLNVDGSAAVIETAAKSRKAAVRAAAAAAAGMLSPQRATPILRRLLKSRVSSVRRWALRSVSKTQPAAHRRELRSIQAGDPDHQLRGLARAILKKA